MKKALAAVLIVVVFFLLRAFDTIGDFEKNAASAIVAHLSEKTGRIVSVDPSNLSDAAAVHALAWQASQFAHCITTTKLAC